MTILSTPQVAAQEARGNPHLPMMAGMACVKDDNDNDNDNDNEIASARVTKFPIFAKFVNALSSYISCRSCGLNLI